MNAGLQKASSAPAALDRGGDCVAVAHVWFARVLPLLAHMGDGGKPGSSLDQGGRGPPLWFVRFLCSQGVSLCSTFLSRSSDAFAGNIQATESIRNPATFVTPTVQCPILTYLIDYQVAHHIESGTNRKKI